MGALRHPTPSASGQGRTRRWRALYVVGLAAAVGSLVGGMAFAYQTTTGTGTGSASTGSVAVTVNVAATHACTYSAVDPGDLTGAATCALSVTYTGSISAWMSLTVAIQAKAGTIAGARPLYDGTNTAGLTLAISDGHNTFTVPTNPANPSGCPAGFSCWTSPNDLAAWYTGATPNLAFTNTSPAVTWTVTPMFPRTAGNAYQGATATVTLTAQAVQSPANPLPATCTTSTIGHRCPTSGSFAWS